MYRQSASLGPHLFVYGTLRRGFDHPMARLLALNALYVGPARVAGRLYHLGNYPGIVLSQRPREWVYGDIYDLGGVSGLLTRLDRYEGLSRGRKGVGEYRRQTVCAFLLDDDSPLISLTYLYLRPVHGLRRLITGDYLRQHRRSPSPLPSR